MWLWCGDLNSFRDIQQIHISGGGLTLEATSNVLILLPVTLGIYMKCSFISSE
jgi:hypothetical protein